MKKVSVLFVAITLSSVLTLGCGTGPSVSTEQEAKDSMDASMNVDTMSETTAPSTGTDAPAAPAAPANP